MSLHPYMYSYDDPVNRVDPMEALSGQPYVYAGGSPTNATDPTGMWRETAIDLASLGAGLADIGLTAIIN